MKRIYIYKHTYVYMYIYIYMGFPGGSVVKNPPGSAGDTSSIPGLGGFPQALELLSLCTSNIETVL